MISSSLRRVLGVLAAIALASLAGCSSGSGSTTTGSSTGSLQVRLTDAPGDYQQVVVTIAGLSVKVAGTAGFTDLPVNTDLGVGGAVIAKDTANGRLTVNLVALANGANVLLAAGDLPPGRIEQIRLMLVQDQVGGTKTPYVVPDGAGAQPESLKVPSGMQSGLKIVPRGVDIEAGSLTAITLDFDARRSVVALGGSARSHRGFDYILKPVIFVKESTSLLRPATTVAVGGNFPTGIAYLHGNAADTTDDRIALANGGTLSSDTGSNASTALLFDPNSYATGTPVDLTDTMGSIQRTTLTNAPSDAAADESSRGAGAFDVTAAGDLLHFDTASFPTAGTDSVGGVLSAVAPAASPFATGSIYFLAKDSDIVVFDPSGPTTTSLGISGLENVTGVAFLPGVPAGSFGTLVVTDRGMSPSDPTDDQIVAVKLTADTTAMTISIDGTPVRKMVEDLDFLSEPVGVAANTAGDGVYVAMRGNGFVEELGADLSFVRILDTGLGPDSLNAITVASMPALAGFDTESEVLLLACTNGGDDPAADDPLDAGNTTVSTVEAVVP